MKESKKTTARIYPRKNHWSGSKLTKKAPYIDNLSELTEITF